MKDLETVLRVLSDSSQKLVTHSKPETFEYAAGYQLALEHVAELMGINLGEFGLRIINRKEEGKSDG